MKKIACIASLFLIICTMVGPPAFCAPPVNPALYFSDLDLGQATFKLALDQLGYPYTTATSFSDFNLKLSTGSWSIAILMVQNNFISTGTLSNLGPYLAGGGKAIFADWTRNPTWGALFGITYASTNQTTVTFDPAASFLGQSLPASIALFNPGWGVFSMGMSLNGATAGARFPNGNIAIAYTQNTIINGMLQDTFSNGAQGVQLAKNEINYLTTVLDTDGDGFPDWWEIKYGTDPNDPNDPNPAEDVDGDGLGWLQEFQYGTDPRNPDTDGDGVSDGREVAIGTNPLVKDGPVTIVEILPGTEWGTAYFRFVVNVPDGDSVLHPERFLLTPTQRALSPAPTGYRVYYGASPGFSRADYPAFFDVGLNQRNGLIDQKWGMQGSPQVFVRIAPISQVGTDVFIGELSNEGSTYFGGTKFVVNSIDMRTEGEVSSSSNSSGCSLTSRPGSPSGATAVATVILLFLPMAVLLLRKRASRRG